MQKNKVQGRTLNTARSDFQFYQPRTIWSEAFLFYLGYKPYFAIVLVFMALSSNG